MNAGTECMQPCKEFEPAWGFVPSKTGTVAHSKSGPGANSPPGPETTDEVLMQ